MIEILSQTVNKAEGTLTIRLRPQDIRLGVVKLSEPELENILTEMGIKRGNRIAGPYTVCNKNTFPDEYAMLYELHSPRKRAPKKVEKKLDNSAEPVKIKKTG